jgi:hypothetical protein
LKNEPKKDDPSSDLLFYKVLYFGMKITSPQKFMKVYFVLGGVNKIKSKFIRQASDQGMFLDKMFELNEFIIKA